MTTSKTDTSDPKEEKQKPHRPVRQQVAISATGEILAFSLAIGAVYVSDKLLPKQTEAFVSHLAEQMGKWRGASAESQKLCVRKILDVSIMNMAGMTGMAAQFGIRRSHQSEKEKTPAWYEIGRLTAGRIIGTFTAISTLALMEIKFPKIMRKTEADVSRKFGANSATDRFSELLLSNSVQAIGAIAGNAPAQLLYDHLVNPPGIDRKPVR